MAYEIGTADNHIELLERLKDFLTNTSRTTASDTNITAISAISASEVWTVQRHDTDYDGNGNDELILKGYGTTAPYVGIRTENGTVAAGDYHNWILQGFTGYSSGSDWDMQPGLISNPPRMLLWNSSISYWFFANDRHFKIVAKVNTVYESCYMGFILPYATPIQLPYPLVIGGSWAGAADRYSNLTEAHSSFIDNRYNHSTYYTLYLLYGMQWYGFNNKDQIRITYPYATNDSDYGYIADLWQNLYSLIDGGACLLPIIMLATDHTLGGIGEFQGCYAVVHDSPSAEDEITIGADTYIVFPNTFNTEAYSYFAMKKE